MNIDPIEYKSWKYTKNKNRYLVYEITDGVYWIDGRITKSDRLVCLVKKEDDAKFISDSHLIISKLLLKIKKLEKIIK